MGLVYSIHDSTEVAIQKMIDASQRMIEEAEAIKLLAYDDASKQREKKINL